MAAHTSQRLLAATLLALGLLYVGWYHDDRHVVASLLVFAAPPLLLAPFVLRGGPKATFWAGVLALFWFSHGVMVAWSHPEQRLFALAEIGLSVLAVLTSSWPGLSARFGRRRR